MQEPAPATIGVVGLTKHPRLNKVRLLVVAKLIALGLVEYYAQGWQYFPGCILFELYLY